MAAGRITVSICYPWHRELIAHVGQQYRERRLPPALLYRSRRGFYDEECGWAIAQLVLCESQTGVDNCKHCLLTEEKEHPNIVCLDAMNDKVGIDDIRLLEQHMWQTSIFDKPKAAFINGMDSLSISAQNALLKTLEEPPQNTYFILSVESISRVLPTIMSRVRRLHHTNIEQYDVLHWLQQQCGENAPTEAVIAKIAKLANNAPEQALALLSDTDQVAHLEKEKQLFVDFLAGKVSAKILLEQLPKEKTDEVLERFCRYTEGMIRFLFEKSTAATDKNAGNSVQYAKWNNISLRAFYRLLDILRDHRHLAYTNVNMTMQLTTSLIDWQYDRKQ
ncbi:MAG: hypothetical protein KGV50_00490 [Gammaproteobacteria bacterium]|nr:hypothetical protein [Gammaproteobacteria bacterium]